MATTIILSQDAPACADNPASVERWITVETVALSVELFGSTYGLDWRTAWNWAASMLPDLLCYAAEWDAAVEEARNVTH